MTGNHDAHSPGGVGPAPLALPSALTQAVAVTVPLTHPAQEPRDQI